ncbi:DnaJ domain containing protein [Novymonas esmeraldas]|uniref:DnaJ domain containing protein n=1 Tax=Novymonas esmeraldas TaxID=1808958 RepID=A0AAW0EKT9_9TRYP
MPSATARGVAPAQNLASSSPLHDDPVFAGSDAEVAERAVRVWHAFVAATAAAASLDTSAHQPALRRAVTCLFGVPALQHAAMLRRRYRLLAVRVHPDKNTSPFASEAFQAVHSCFEHAVAAFHSGAGAEAVPQTQHTAEETCTGGGVDVVPPSASASSTSSSFSTSSSSPPLSPHSSSSSSSSRSGGGGTGSRWHNSTDSLNRAAPPPPLVFPHQVHRTAMPASRGAPPPTSVREPPDVFATAAPPPPPPRVFDWEGCSPAVPPPTVFNMDDNGVRDAVLRRPAPPPLSEAASSAQRRGGGARKPADGGAAQRLEPQRGRRRPELPTLAELLKALDAVDDSDDSAEDAGLDEGWPASSRPGARHTGSTAALPSSAPPTRGYVDPDTGCRRAAVPTHASSRTSATVAAPVFSAFVNAGRGERASHASTVSASSTPSWRRVGFAGGEAWDVAAGATHSSVSRPNPTAPPEAATTEPTRSCRAGGGGGGAPRRAAVAGAQERCACGMARRGCCFLCADDG